MKYFVEGLGQRGGDSAGLLVAADHLRMDTQVVLGQDITRPPGSVSHRPLADRTPHERELGHLDREPGRAGRVAHHLDGRTRTPRRDGAGRHGRSDGTGYRRPVEPTRQPRHEIRRYGAADWRQVREIRLEMLADSPLAYVESLTAAQRYPAEEWQARAAWAERPHCLGLAVVLGETGRWVGLARSSVMADLAERAFVFGVYLAPDLRGHGIADDLFDRVERWVRAEGTATSTSTYTRATPARSRSTGAAATPSPAAASPTGSTPPSPSSRWPPAGLTWTHPAPTSALPPDQPPASRRRRQRRPNQSDRRGPGPSRRSEVRAQVRQVGGAEPVAGGVALVPVRVAQRRLADLVEPGPLRRR